MEMMIIQALKKIKSLKQEVEDLRQQIAAHCADFENESPVYGTEEAQQQQIRSWLQAIHDKLLLVQELSLRVKYTNLTTMVTIDDEVQSLTLPLEQWVIMRREIAPIKVQVYSSIGDRGLKDKDVRTSSGGTDTVKVRRYYDPVRRDQNLARYKKLASVIDSHLEVVNATTPLKQLP